MLPLANRSWVLLVATVSACGSSVRGGGTSGPTATSSGSSAGTGAADDSSGDGEGDGGSGGEGGSGGTSAGTTTTGSSGATGGTTGGATSATTGDSGDSSGGIRLDVGTATSAGSSGGEGGGAGCEKIDFLFVIDNSGSMGDEQNHLAASFPGFLSTIQSTLMASDYHIMAVDTDPVADHTIITCTPEPSCCATACGLGPPDAVCAGMPCVPPDEPCDALLGAGKNDDRIGNPCGLDSGFRYMLDSQANLDATFDCIARVGTGGSGNEQQAGAAVAAVSPAMNGVGGCNEGFVRDDAILVVTIITDEEDGMDDDDSDRSSMGTPATWKQALVDAKRGDENAVVVLGLVGDTDLPGALCTNLSDSVGAEPAPNLRMFLESFTYGSWGSVCSTDYTPFFQAAVSVIDTACDTFVPPG